MRHQSEVKPVVFFFPVKTDGQDDLKTVTPSNNAWKIGVGIGVPVVCILLAAVGVSIYLKHQNRVRSGLGAMLTVDTGSIQFQLEGK